MAAIPGSGQINLSTVLSLMGISAGANTNRSLRDVNITAMGGASVANSRAANSLCMPYESSASASLGSNGTRAPGANWTASATNWGQNSLADFRGSYNAKPNLSLSFTRVGNITQVRINCTAFGSDAGPGGASFQTGTYYFLITGPGSTPGMNVWTAAQSGGNYSSYLVTSTYYGNSYVVRVQDYQGCGNRQEFTASIRYY